VRKRVGESRKGACSRCPCRCTERQASWKRQAHTGGDAGCRLPGRPAYQERAWARGIPEGCLDAAVGQGHTSRVLGCMGQGHTSTLSLSSAFRPWKLRPPLPVLALTPPLISLPALASLGAWVEAQLAPPASATPRAAYCCAKRQWRGRACCPPGNFCCALPRLGAIEGSAGVCPRAGSEGAGSSGSSGQPWEERAETPKGEWAAAVRPPGAETRTESTRSLPRCELYCRWAVASVELLACKAFRKLSWPSARKPWP